MTCENGPAVTQKSKQQSALLLRKAPLFQHFKTLRPHAFADFKKIERNFAITVTKYKPLLFWFINQAFMQKNA